jgi:hypothetical protein
MELNPPPSENMGGWRGILYIICKSSTFHVVILPKEKRRIIISRPLFYDVLEFIYNEKYIYVWIRLLHY